MSKRPIAPLDFAVDDFSGGVTDFYVGNKDKRKYQTADNLVINENKKLESRPGCEIFNSTSPRISTGNRIHAVLENNNEIFQHADKSIWYDNDANQTKLLGPSGNEVFPHADEYTQGAFVNYNDQIICASDIREEIVKVFTNDQGTKKALTLGLPNVNLYTAITLANSIKTNFNAHIADASAHILADGVNTVSAANATDFKSLMVLVKDLIIKYKAHQSDAVQTTPTYHAAKEVIDTSLLVTDNPRTLTEAINNLVQLKSKFNEHDNEGTAHNTTGGHQESNNHQPYVTSAVPGSSNFLYAFYYEHRFYVGDELHLERGPVTIIEATNLDSPTNASRRIHEIGVLTNSANTHYETSEIKVVIGRTTDNGDVIYKLGEIANGITQFDDNVLDDDLVLNETFYTEGGVKDDTQPPAAKYLSLANDIVAFINIEEGNNIKGNRVRFSKKYQPFSSPEDYILDFEEELTGGGRIGVYHIIFSQNMCWRIEGFIDDLGRGAFIKREIDNEIGCISHRSITPIKEGLLFAAKDGFYYTDGFATYKISTEINERYEKLMAKNYIAGTYEKNKNRVLFSCRTDNGDDFNNIIYCGHIDYRNGTGDVPFTTWSGNKYKFSATALTYYNEKILRGDYRGYLLEHSSEYDYDKLVDENTDVANWVELPIIYLLVTLAYDFGLSSVRKWVSKIIFNAQNLSSLSVEIQTCRDNSGLFFPLKPIINDSNIEWGDTSVSWKDTSLLWNYIKTISAWRWFPSKTIRSQYRQLSFTNAHREIDNSDVKGAVTTDPVLKTLTLNNISEKWISKAKGYNISTSYDDYNLEFLIINRTDSTLTVLDPDDDLPSGVDLEWKITGQKKNELLSVIDYTLLYSNLTSTQDHYRKESND